MLYESNFDINVQFRSSLEFEKDLYLDRKKSFVRSPDTRRIFFLHRNCWQNDLVHSQIFGSMSGEEQWINKLTFSNTDMNL